MIHNTTGATGEIRTEGGASLQQSSDIPLHNIQAIQHTTNYSHINPTHNTDNNTTTKSNRPKAQDFFQNTRSEKLTPNNGEHVHEQKSKICSVPNTLNIITHNINGLRDGDSKLFTLIEYCKNKDIDVIGITESNLKRREGEFKNANPQLNSTYKSFWTTRDQKIKGSGVSLLIHNRMEKFIGKVIRMGAYYIEVTIYLKRCTIAIGSVYYPPSDKNTQNQLTLYITKELATLTSHARTI